MRYGQNNVITAIALITWNGCVPPDKDERTGNPVWTMGVAYPKSSPEAAELRALCQEALNASEFKGVMPAGGSLPFQECDTAKLGPLVTGMERVSAKTYNGMPQVLDKDGADVPQMALASQLYPGCKVKLMVHAYVYNKAGNKGVALGLDAIQIIDSTAEKLPVMAGPTAADVRAAFGGQAAASTPAAQSTPASAGTTMPKPPPRPNKEFLQAPNKLSAAGIAAGGTYEAFIAEGWTDDDLRAQGYLA